eukprot:scaffold327766_cov99-Tisochrysis_lutea.AAC.2
MRRLPTAPRASKCSLTGPLSEGYASHSRGTRLRPWMSVRSSSRSEPLCGRLRRAQAASRTTIAAVHPGASTQAKRSVGVSARAERTSPSSPACEQEPRLDTCAPITPDVTKPLSRAERAAAVERTIDSTPAKHIIARLAATPS